MSYRFKSPACADVLLLDASARQILQIIGKADSAQGVISPGDVPAAVAALEQAVAREAGQHAQAGAAADPDAGEHDGDAPISLHQRVVPFIELLRQSAAAGARVTWGV